MELHFRPARRQPSPLETLSVRTIYVNTLCSNVFFLGGPSFLI